jgi:tetratricopeptide (TPR) repeat protein
MNAEAILTWLDSLIPAHTGERLSELERVILQQVWQGRKYLEIANQYGCTEGHAKDVGSRLWKLLSKTLKQKITKSNCRSILERCFCKAATISGLLEKVNPPITLVGEMIGTVEIPIIEAATISNINFLGRENAIAHLYTLVSRGVKVIVIQGEGGLGKTTLAQEFLENCGFDLVLELLMAKETQNITAAEYVLEEWLKQDFHEEPGVEFGVSLLRLKRQLHNRKIGVLIDNLEPALDENGRFIKAHRNYVDLLRVLGDTRVQSVTLITSRDRLCEPGLNVEHYRLPGLDESAWVNFFQSRGLNIDLDKLDLENLNLSSLQQMHHAYGGNAKAMGILCGTIQEDFAGNIVKYWQQNHANPLAAIDLKNLVVSQINRLKNLDIQAYKLLCRLGCYRYQDIPTVPASGLYSLLWDVPTSLHRQIINSLRNRSLIECDRDEYWLHPVVRTEAISRLRTSEDWQITNHKSAEFWSDRIQKIATFKDALQALEAYYHYLEIEEFELAGKVILKSRNNQWKQYLPLGSTLYRMGWIQPLICSINQVIANVNSELNISELYNILGDLYWIAGKIDFAIACQEKTIDLARQGLKSLIQKPNIKHKYYLRMLEVDSLLSIGLYQLDLWELETSAQLFQKVIHLAQNTDHHRWAEKSFVCLALVNSYLGLDDSAKSFAEVAYQHIIRDKLIENTGGYIYFIQLLGQTYVNLGNFVRANEMFAISLNFAEKSHYMQVKAKSLIGLAEINRQQSEFELALIKHHQSIEILDKIGAKCDLAISYYQLALTYQQMSNFTFSKLELEKAIKIFQEMEAPKQINRFKSPD